MIGKSAWDTIHPDDLKGLKKAYDQVLENENAQGTVECRYRCKDDSYKWIVLTALNSMNNPSVNGILLNYYDNEGI